MKLFEELEPKLTVFIKGKGAARISYRKEKTLRQRATRRFLNRNFNSGNEVLKRRFGYEW